MTPIVNPAAVLYGLDGDAEVETVLAEGLVCQEWHMGFCIAWDWNHGCRNQGDVITGSLCYEPWKCSLTDVRIKNALRGVHPVINPSTEKATAVPQLRLSPCRLFPKALSINHQHLLVRGQSSLS